MFLTMAVLELGVMLNWNGLRREWEERVGGRGIGISLEEFATGRHGVKRAF